MPPHVFFVVSAVFHYLGPSFAVLLFALVEPLGVAWLRIASAAIIFALLAAAVADSSSAPTGGRSADRLGLGATLAAMNAVFYLAIDRMPLATVASIEFVATIAVALAGVAASESRGARRRARRRLCADRIRRQRRLFWHSSSRRSMPSSSRSISCSAMRSRASRSGSSVDRLGAAMLVALVLAAPFGIKRCVALLSSARCFCLPASASVSSSSVIPYVCDQLAMARLPRATFALMLALLPATAAIVGAVVLGQIPSPIELLGIALVAIGIAIHKPAGA